MSMKIKFVPAMSWDAMKKNTTKSRYSWAFKSALEQNEQQAWKAIVIEK